MSFKDLGIKSFIDEKADTELGYTNMLPMSLSSDSSGQKDTLIDEMQVRFGELLNCNQELYQTKNENELLKQSLIDKDKQFRIEKISLLDEIESLKTQLQTQESRTSELEKECNSLKQKNEYLTNKIEEIKNDHEKSSSDLVSQAEATIETKTNEFKIILHDKDQEIDTLKAQINGLMKEVSELKKENKMKKQKIVETSSSYNQLENEFSKLTEQKSNTEASMSRIIGKSKSLKMVNADQHNQIQMLSTKVNEQNEQLACLLEKQKNQDEKISLYKDFTKSIKAIIPGAESFPQILECIRNRFQYLDEVSQAFYNAKRKLKKVKRILNSHSEMLTTQESRNEELVLNSEELKKQIHSITLDNNQNCERIQGLYNKIKTSAIIEQENRVLNSGIDSIVRVLNPESESMLKSVIFTSIILKRWKMLIGTPKVYVNDTRNWWWLSTLSRRGLVLNQIESQIQQMISEATIMKSRIEDLCSEKDDLQQYANRIQKELDSEKDKSSILVSSINESEKRIQEMTERSNYDQAVMKYKNSKQKISELESDLSSKLNTIAELQNTISHLKDSNLEKSSTIDISAKQKSQIITQLSEAEEKITILQKALSTKNHEILALERMKRPVNR